MKGGEDDLPTLSRVERSLRLGFWHFPLEPTSLEICAALTAREQHRYADGYPDNLVALNRFFVMHKVGYRNGKGVKLEGWKSYDDHLMTKTSSGPLNGNEDLVLRIFALKPVIKGMEPIKLCWVKELSKGHQSGRRKKTQPEDETSVQKKVKPNHSTFIATPGNHPSPRSPLANTPSMVSFPSNDNNTSNFVLQTDDHASSRQEGHSPLSPAKSNNSIHLPKLHVTLAEVSGSLAPIHLPPMDPSFNQAPSPPPVPYKKPPPLPLLPESNLQHHLQTLSRETPLLPTSNSSYICTALPSNYHQPLGDSHYSNNYAIQSPSSHSSSSSFITPATRPISLTTTHLSPSSTDIHHGPSSTHIHHGSSSTHIHSNPPSTYPPTRSYRNNLGVAAPLSPPPLDPTPPPSHRPAGISLRERKYSGRDISFVPYHK